MKTRLLLQLSVLLTLIVVTMFGLSRPSVAQESPDESPLETAIRGGERLLSHGEWAKAEAYFREGVRVEPRRGLWHVYLAVALEKQGKTEAVHEEMNKLTKLGEIGSFLVFHEKAVPGRLSFVNTKMFEDEQHGIIRYLNAVKRKKNVEKVSEDIGKGLDAYARKHGIAVILDSNKFKEAHFFSDASLDVTSDFIAEYNAQHPE